MRKSEQDLRLDAERGAVSTIIKEMKTSSLPHALLRELLLIAIGVQAELAGRRVESNEDYMLAFEKTEDLQVNLTFGSDDNEATKRYLKKS